MVGLSGFLQIRVFRIKKTLVFDSRWKGQIRTGSLSPFFVVFRDRG